MIDGDVRREADVQIAGVRQRGLICDPRCRAMKEIECSVGARSMLDFLRDAIESSLREELKATGQTREASCLRESSRAKLRRGRNRPDILQFEVTCETGKHCRIEPAPATARLGQ